MLVFKALHILLMFAAVTFLVGEATYFAIAIWRRHVRIGSAAPAGQAPPVVGALLFVLGIIFGLLTAATGRLDFFAGWLIAAYLMVVALFVVNGLPVVQKGLVSLAQHALEAGRSSDRRTRVGRRWPPPPHVRRRGHRRRGAVCHPLFSTWSSSRSEEEAQMVAAKPSPSAPSPSRNTGIPFVIAPVRVSAGRVSSNRGGTRDGRLSDPRGADAPLAIRGESTTTSLTRSDHDDAVLEFPQSGERFVGKENFLTWRKQYPADLDFRMRRITHDGDLWVAENLISYDGSPWMFTVSILQLRGDKIAHGGCTSWKGSEAADLGGPNGRRCLIRSRL